MMKKISLLLSVLALAVGLQAASIKILMVRTNVPSYNGAQAAYLKIYYGGQLNTYTNSAIGSVTSTTTNVIPAFDPFACTGLSVNNCIVIPIYGLQYTQQFFYAWSVINTNGQESPIIAASVCGFTVTNKNDLLNPPTNLRTK